MYFEDKLQMADRAGDVNTDPFWVTLNRLQTGGHRWPKMGLSPHQSAHSGICPLCYITPMIYWPASSSEEEI